MVRTLLGRDPQGAFEVVSRDDRGWPVVIRNAPLLDDGTPMPTSYWLVGEDQVRRVGHLEAAGGVRFIERLVEAAALDAAHQRYAADRDALMPADHTGPRPSGGVGGTRTGVKCLHAHYAWFLAGGDDPVGRWVAEQLGPPARVELVLDAQFAELRCPVPPSGAPWSHRLPVTPSGLVEEFLTVDDPPLPEDLTNAIGRLADHLDDVRRARPELIGHEAVRVAGPLATTIARVEIGSDEIDDEVVLDRDAAEDVFRTVVTEARDDRRHNPGLPTDHLDLVMAAACTLVTTMRRLHLDRVIVSTAPPLRTAD